MVSLAKVNLLFLFRIKSTPLCFLKQNLKVFCDKAISLSPSIEYAAHPDFAKVCYHKDLKKYYQVVLQCRCNLDEGALHSRKGSRFPADELIDRNFQNDDLEWEFKPGHRKKSTQEQFIMKALVCSALMIRVTDYNPETEGRFWWYIFSYFNCFEFSCLSSFQNLKYQNLNLN